MELRQDIPEDVPHDLIDQLPPEARLAFRVFGDIGLDGQYGRCVLAADDERLYYASLNGDEKLPQFQRVEFRDIRDVRLESFVGNGSLLIDREQDSVEVARFSQTTSAAFEAAAGQLAELAAKHSGEIQDEQRLKALSVQGRKQGRCPKCGRALSPRAEICLYCADKRKLVLRLISLLRPHWHVVVIGLAITLASTLLGLIPAWLTKDLIDKAIIPVNWSRFYTYLAIYLGCFVFLGFFNYIRTRMMGWLGQKIIYDLRMSAFDQLQKLSLRYYESKQTGRLMSRLTNDCERIERFVVEVLQELIVDSLTLVLVFVMLANMNWQLALISVAPTPVVFVLVYFFSRRIKSTYRKAWRTSAALSAHLADIIPGVRVVKGFAREKEERQHFDSRSRQLFGHNMRVFNLRASVFPAINFISRLGYALVWGVGGYMAIQEIVSNPDLAHTARQSGTMIGTLAAFSALLWRFYEPIGRLSRVTDQVNRATTSAERVFELLDAFPDVSEPEQPKSLGRRARGHIEFRKISFAYEPNVPVLRDVDLDIKPGEMIGIVGHSGVGKSTLASLLLRFYDPDGGQVLLDGVDVREMSGRELRRNIGLVLQEPNLFHGSVLDNIRYSQPDAPLQRVIEAARIANAHDFLMRLPEGYDTHTGERGVRLSQGEKQRVSIARAILRDPPILILDEATASVDTETERLIQGALDRLIEGRTVLAIAHRLSTLRNADRIIVLNEGRIAEMGTHEELLAAEGIYYELCEAQSMMGRGITPSPLKKAATTVVEEPVNPLEEEVPEYGQEVE